MLEESNNVSKIDRVEWIDIVRGIAIILIITGHSIIGYDKTFFAAMIYAVHVPVFFVLSGYLFKKRKNIIQYIKHLSLTLLLPYFFTGLLIVLLTFISQKETFGILQPYMNNGTKWVLGAVAYGIGGEGILQIAGHTIYPPFIGAIWFLVAMFCGNILFNCTIGAAQKIGKNEPSIIYIESLISLVLCVIGFMLGLKAIRLPWSMVAALVVQPFYSIGYIARNKKILENNNGRSVWLFVISMFVWILAAVSGFFYVEGGWANNPWSAMIGAIAGSYALIFIAKFIEQKFHYGSCESMKKYLIMMGKSSMVVLCFHLIGLNNINMAGRIVSIFDGNNLHLLGIISVVIYRIVLCSLICFSVPKVPFIRSIFLNSQYPFKARTQYNLK